ncbi:hypothetical protein RND81_02G232900 [Saponaria officinalis]|uniref:Pentatricopeptide repeat-containing protein n=1 Tax=Saponaria officinalis TaxID=3572 RepID=A0AAW1MWG6_SAPOF
MSLKMQHLLLKLSVRSNFNGKFWTLLISSTNSVKISGFCTCPSNYFRERTINSSEVDLIVKKVHVGRSEEEILSSLVHDEVCEAISLSRSFVDTLLRRFRDDWKAALAVFRWVESRSYYEHLPEEFDLIVDILGKAKQFSKMRKLVNEMRERNLVSINTVAKMMRRFSGARQWKDAVRTFDELRTFGLEKNTESMNLLLDTLCKENQVEMARVIFMELKSHISPSLHTFNIFIHGWCKIKRVEEADWTLQEMKGCGFAPCVISYSTIIKSYCHLLNWEKVYELLDVMKAQGCQPSVVTYTIIMSSLTKVGKFEDALKIGDMVKSSGYKADTTFYNALIHTYGKARLVREAFEVFKVEMPKNGVPPNTETYNTLIAMFCYHGQEHMAFEILEDLEKSGVCKADLQTYDPLLKFCLRLQMTEHHLSKLLDDMVTKHHLSLDVSTYSLLIHGLCRIGDCEWAFRLFEEMVDKGLILRYQTCRLLFDAVNQKSMSDAAETIDNYMRHLRDAKQDFPGSRVSIN